MSSLYLSWPAGCYVRPSVRTYVYLIQFHTGKSSSLISFLRSISDRIHSGVTLFPPALPSRDGSLKSEFFPSFSNNIFERAHQMKIFLFFLLLFLSNDIKKSYDGFEGGVFKGRRDQTKLRELRKSIYVFPTFRTRSDHDFTS